MPLIFSHVTPLLEIIPLAINLLPLFISVRTICLKIEPTLIMIIIKPFVLHHSTLTIQEIISLPLTFSHIAPLLEIVPFAIDFLPFLFCIRTICLEVEPALIIVIVNPFIFSHVTTRFEVIVSMPFFLSITTICFYIEPTIVASIENPFTLSF